VWVLYPKSQDLHVFQPDRVFVLKADEVLNGGDLLPGFAVKMSELFIGSHATP
jgi:hypothetical protein